jgi:hypothetical protein
MHPINPRSQGLRIAMTRLIRAFNRLLDGPAQSEPVHFHHGSFGTPVVCHDEHCGSPRLDLRDARELSAATGDLR